MKSYQEIHDSIQLARLHAGSMSSEELTLLAGEYTQACHDLNKSLLRAINQIKKDESPSHIKKYAAVRIGLVNAYFLLSNPLRAEWLSVIHFLGLPAPPEFPPHEKMVKLIQWVQDYRKKMRSEADVAVAYSAAFSEELEEEDSTGNHAELDPPSRGILNVFSLFHATNLAPPALIKDKKDLHSLKDSISDNSINPPPVSGASDYPGTVPDLPMPSGNIPSIIPPPFSMPSSVNAGGISSYPEVVKESQSVPPVITRTPEPKVFLEKNIYRNIRYSIFIMVTLILLGMFFYNRTSFQDYLDAVFSFQRDDGMKRDFIPNPKKDKDAEKTWVHEKNADNPHSFKPVGENTSENSTTDMRSYNKVGGVHGEAEMDLSGSIPEKETAKKNAQPSSPTDSKQPPVVTDVTVASASPSKAQKAENITREKSAEKMVLEIESARQSKIRSLLRQLPSHLQYKNLEYAEIEPGINDIFSQLWTHRKYLEFIFHTGVQKHYFSPKTGFSEMTHTDIARLYSIPLSEIKNRTYLVGTYPSQYRSWFPLDDALIRSWEFRRLYPSGLEGSVIWSELGLQIKHQHHGHTELLNTILEIILRTDPARARDISARNRFYVSFFPLQSPILTQRVRTDSDSRVTQAFSSCIFQRETLNLTDGTQFLEFQDSRFGSALINNTLNCVFSWDLSAASAAYLTVKQEDYTTISGMKTRISPAVIYLHPEGTLLETLCRKYTFSYQLTPDRKKIEIKINASPPSEYLKLHEQRIFTLLEQLKTMKTYEKLKTCVLAVRPDIKELKRLESVFYTEDTTPEQENIWEEISALTQAKSFMSAPSIPCKVDFSFLTLEDEKP